MSFKAEPFIHFKKEFKEQISRKRLDEKILLRGGKSFADKAAISGVYLWGFDFGRSPNDVIIYYIGRSTKHVIERMMQEFTQLLFGGFGAIFDFEYLKRNRFNAGLHSKLRDYKKEFDKGCMAPFVLDPKKPRIYFPFGMDDIGCFLKHVNGLNKRSSHPGKDAYFRDGENWLKATISKMAESLIFTWIAIKGNGDIVRAEKMLHEIVGNNILGLGNGVARTTAYKFDDKKEQISGKGMTLDFTDNTPLYKYLKTVHEELSKTSF